MFAFGSLAGLRLADEAGGVILRSGGRISVGPGRFLEWSIGQLRAQAQVHELAINPIIYAELSLAFATVEALDAVVGQMRLIVVDVPRPALFLAGQAFLRYRRAGGGKSNVPSDFFIGAHAAVARCPLLTRDARRYRAYFPTVDLIAP